MDVFLPEDLEAEKMAIGCVLEAPAVHARKAFRELWGSHFADEYHGWIWSRLSWASKKVDWDAEGNREVLEFLKQDGAWERARRYGGHLGYDLFRFARPCLWWNLHWYTSRVRGAYKRRFSIVEARVHIGTLLTEARNAGLKGYEV